MEILKSRRQVRTLIILGVVLCLTRAATQPHTYQRAAGGRSYFYIKSAWRSGHWRHSGVWHGVGTSCQPREQNEELTLSKHMSISTLSERCSESTRPTAVNLRWAIERMLRRADHAISEHCFLPNLAQILKNEAQAIADEDFQACEYGPLRSTFDC